MASNSTACKTWCVTIASATVVLVADKNRPDYIWVALFPTLLFCFLDSYYLAQERCFRDIYNAFVTKIHSNSATIKDLYTMKGVSGFCLTLKSLFIATTSVSVWPFYGLIIVMLMVVRWVILGETTSVKEAVTWLR
jgi:hypothetical protein